MTKDPEPDDPPKPARLQAGEHIGERYQVVRLLGEGGIGSVYEAVNTWTGRRVAVKVLQPGVASGEDILRRFKLEAQASSTLRHPNIVDVLDMGPDPRTGALFIVQELLKGTDLRGHLERRRRLGVAEAFDLMIPVIGALVAAHSKSILHRDVKPENIFLAKGDDGAVTPKLIDFGLAKLLGEEAAKRGKTRSGVMLGTPAYMSPEQFQGASEVDGRADVWSVGAVLYELLTGSVPFDGPTVMAIMWRASQEPPKRLESLTLAVPADVAELVHATLQADRDLRPPTMRALLDAVLACPSLALAEGPSLAQKHQRSLAQASAEDRPPTGSPLPPIDVAPTLAGPLSTPSPASAPEATPSPIAAPTSTPRPTPLEWSGERSLLEGPPIIRSGLPFSRRAVIAVIAAGLLGGVGVMALKGSGRQDVGSTRQAGSPTVVAREEPAATPIQIDEVADAGADSTAPVAPSVASPAAVVHHGGPHHAHPPGTSTASPRADDHSPTAPAGPVPRPRQAEARGGYDPDRLLTP